MATVTNLEYLYLDTTCTQTSSGDVNRKGVEVYTESILKTINYCIGAFGIAGNVLVMWVLSKNTKLAQATTRVLLINQSLLDLTAGLFLILTTKFQDLEGVKPGIIGEVYCKLWLTKLLLWGTFFSSTLNLCTLSIERYIAVSKPFALRMMNSKLLYLATAVLVWILGLSYNVATKVPTAIVVDARCILYGNWPNQAASKATGVVTFILEFAGPMVLITFCYSRMILILRNSARQVQPAVGSSNSRIISNCRSKVSQDPARRNLLKTLVWMSVMFVLCWVCNQVYFLLINLGMDLNFANTFYHMTVIAAFCNCCVNPCIYMVRYKLCSRSGIRLVLRGSNSQGQGSTS